MCTHVHLPGLGRFVILYIIVPVAPFQTECQLHGYASDVKPCDGKMTECWTLGDTVLGRWLRRTMCRVIMLALRATLLQDRDIWETKRMHQTRNSCKGDYSWVKFDKWLDQFYSAGSVRIEKNLTW